MCLDIIYTCKHTYTVIVHGEKAVHDFAKFAKNSKPYIKYFLKVKGDIMA